jgi:molecular chaperone GrpE (heat shock protein)
MTEPTAPGVPRLPKLPFIVGDVLLLLLAGALFWMGRHFPGQGGPMLVWWEAVALTVCVALGAGLSIAPWILEHRAAVRLLETRELEAVVEKVQNLDEVGRLIRGATAGWQAVQDDARRAMDASRELAEQMSAEAKSFQEFLQRSQDAERERLRLEVEKLRRSEADWIQVGVRILDHVFALHQAAVRSGQAGLADQIGQFQHACRDAARRIGLVPYTVRAGDPFDPDICQPTAPEPAPTPESRVAETAATGYRFQGQLLRKALVALKAPLPEAEALSIRQIAQRRAESESAAAAQRAQAEPVPAASPDPQAESEAASQPALAEDSESVESTPSGPASAADAVSSEPEVESRVYPETMLATDSIIEAAETTEPAAADPAPKSARSSQEELGL